VIDISEHLPALQVVVPMLSAGMVMLLRPRGLAWAAATAVSIFAFAIAIALTLTVLEVERQTYLMGSWAAPYGIELAVDAFSALLLLIVTGASSLALLVGYRSLDARGYWHCLVLPASWLRPMPSIFSCSWKSRRSRATCWSRVGRTGVR
jgi:multicomponent Na+:H+ antiporter subunit D